MVREPAPAPPKGFRPHMSLQTKLEAALIALGMEPRLVEWHHEPPLQLRVWCPVKGDTIPAANDPRHIVPVIRDEHRERSAKLDVPAIAKTRRLSDEQEELRRRLTAKAPGEPREAAPGPRLGPPPQRRGRATAPLTKQLPPRRWQA